MKTTEELKALRESITQGMWFTTEGPTYGVNSHLKIEAPDTPEHDCGMVICDRNVSTIGDDIDLECRSNFKALELLPDLLSEVIKLREALGTLRSGFKDADAVNKFIDATLNPAPDNG